MARCWIKTVAGWKRVWRLKYQGYWVHQSEWLIRGAGWGGAGVKDEPEPVLGDGNGRGIVSLMVSFISEMRSLLGMVNLRCFRHSHMEKDTFFHCRWNRGSVPQTEVSSEYWEGTCPVQTGNGEWEDKCKAWGRQSRMHGWNIRMARRSESWAWGGGGQ